MWSNGFHSAQARGSRRYVGRSSWLPLWKKFLLTFGFLGLCVGAPSSAEAAVAHGGGLDGDGGHNCYVSACAGTYHCHRPWGGRCRAGVATQVATTTTQPFRSTAIPQPPARPTTTTRPMAAASCISQLPFLTTAETVLLQRTLQGAGAYRSAVDGVLGAETVTAVISVANRFRMEVPDPTRPTRQFLQALDVSCVKEVVPTTRSQFARTGVDGAVCIDQTDGIKSDEVVLLQLALAGRTHAVGPIDGVLGPQTFAALRGFEESQEFKASSPTEIREESLRRLGVSCSLPLRSPPVTARTSEVVTTTLATSPTVSPPPTFARAQSSSPDQGSGTLVTLLAGGGIGALTVMGLNLLTVRRRRSRRM